VDDLVNAATVIESLLAAETKAASIH